MNTIGLDSVIQSIKKHKLLFLIVCPVAVALGVMVAFSLPKQYKSTASLAAESKENSPLGGSMGSLASLAGVNLSKSDDAIVPELYPNVIVTNDFLVSILKSKVRPKGAKKEITYFEYLKKHTRKPWWGEAIDSLTSKLGSSSKPKKEIHLEKINPIALTVEEDGLIEGLKGKILCTIDTENDIINIQAYAQDAYVAKQLVEIVTRQLQRFITDYRTNKSRVDLAYYKNLKKESYNKYVKAQKKYAAYCDSHMDLTLKTYQVESDALENDLQLTYNEYSQTCQHVTLAEAKVQERTPAFTILEQATVSPLADSPKKKFIVAGFFFVAFLGCLCYSVLHDFNSNKKSCKEMSDCEEEKTKEVDAEDAE